MGRREEYTGDVYVGRSESDYFGALNGLLYVVLGRTYADNEAGDVSGWKVLRSWYDCEGHTRVNESRDAAIAFLKSERAHDICIVVVQYVDKWQSDQGRVYHSHTWCVVDYRTNSVMPFGTNCAALRIAVNETVEFHMKDVAPRPPVGKTEEVKP